MQYYELEAVYYRVDASGVIEVWSEHNEQWERHRVQDAVRLHTFASLLKGPPGFCPEDPVILAPNSYGEDDAPLPDVNHRDGQGRLCAAEQIARRAHAGQVDRQGVDYILHPERVAHAVPEYADAAWLHDVLEDTQVTPEELAAAGISTATIASLRHLSKLAGESYAGFIERIATSGDAAAIAVKIADLRDNLRPGGPPHLRQRYVDALARLAPVAP